MSDYEKRNVFVVCDGEEAQSCVKSIAAMIIECNPEYHVSIISASDFRESMLEDDKVIIVGHNELAIHYLLKLESHTTEYGVKIAYTNLGTGARRHVFVIRATGKYKGLSTLQDYYDYTIHKKQGIAEKYGIPFERYDSCRSNLEYQYNLMVLQSEARIKRSIKGFLQYNPIKY